MPGEHGKNRLRQHMEGPSQKSREYVEEYPFSSAMICFGLGVGAGLILASILSENTMSQRQATVAQRLGKQILDALNQVLPESVSDKFHP